MMKYLLVLFLAAPAGAACPLGGGQLNLEIPAAGGSGTEWAACIRRDLLKLSTGTVSASSATFQSTSPTAGHKFFRWLSSGGVELGSMNGGGTLAVTYGVSAGSATIGSGGLRVTGETLLGAASASGIGQIGSGATLGGGARVNMCGSASSSCGGTGAFQYFTKGGADADHIFYTDQGGGTVERMRLSGSNGLSMSPGNVYTSTWTLAGEFISRSSITTTGGLFGTGLTLTNGRLTQTLSQAGQYGVTFNNNATNSFGVKINGGTTSAQYALLVNDSDDVDTLLAVQGGGNIGIGTTSPATTLDVNGTAQFGSGATKSTFTATPGGATYALQLSSGVNIAAGGVYLNTGGQIRWPDGTISTSAFTTPGAPSTFSVAGITSTAQPNTTSTLGVCVTGSTRTITMVGTKADVCYSGGAEFGGAGQGIIGFLVNGAFQNGQSSSEGATRFSKDSSGSADASFCGKATGLTIGVQYNFCLTFASNSPAITLPANNNAGAQFSVESKP